MVPSAWRRPGTADAAGALADLPWAKCISLVNLGVCNPLNLASLGCLSPSRWLTLGDPGRSGQLGSWLDLRAFRIIPDDFLVALHSVRPPRVSALLFARNGNRGDNGRLHVRAALGRTRAVSAHILGLQNNAISRRSPAISGKEGSAPMLARGPAGSVPPGGWAFGSLTKIGFCNGLCSPKEGIATICWVLSWGNRCESAFWKAAIPEKARIHCKPQVWRLPLALLNDCFVAMRRFGESRERPMSKCGASFRSLSWERTKAPPSFTLVVVGLQEGYELALGEGFCEVVALDVVGTHGF